jgi:hypothetical protein
MLPPLISDEQTGQCDGGVRLARNSPRIGERGRQAGSWRRCCSNGSARVHRHDSPSRGLPRQTGSCWPATPHTCIRRWVVRVSTSVRRMRSIGMEAGPGGQRDVARKPPATPSDGANGASPSGRLHEGPGRLRLKALRHGRASQMIGRDVGSGRSLRPRRGTPAARPPHARSRLVTPAARRGFFTLQPDARPPGSDNLKLPSRVHVSLAALPR